MTETVPPSPIARRSFLGAGAAAAAGLALGGPLQAFAAVSAGASSPRPSGGRPGGLDYGPLAPAFDQTTGLPLLCLPRGFEYFTYGWTGDPMSNGAPTPGAHDGMAAFRQRDKVVLVRNHERGGDEGAFRAPGIYDPAAEGGTTNLTFDLRRERFVEARPTLSGTIRNCAGGATPRGTWLTCEETVIEPGWPTPAAGAADNVSKLTRKHGYVFEVPTDGDGDPTALVGMGRFSHEAVAVDPTTGYVYLTEDAGSSGVYRFRPNVAGNYKAGGALEMLSITSARNTASFNAATGGYDTGTGQVTGDTYATGWVPIDDPDPDLKGGAPSCYAQGAALGGALFRRGEGAWYGNGLVYIVSTSGGDARQGQIFAYDPLSSTLTLVFESPGAETLNAPDNITVSPRGGIVLCEDGDGAEYLHGLTPDGEIFRLAQNNVVLPSEFAATKGYTATDYTGSEWAGATFEPRNGRWLFVNIQSPGITFAITGPWRKGAL